jgi:hypothetical protein
MQMTLGKAMQAMAEFLFSFQNHLFSFFILAEGAAANRHRLLRLEHPNHPVAAGAACHRHKFHSAPRLEPEAGLALFAYICNLTAISLPNRLP